MLLVAPYAGQSFASGTKLLRVEELVSPQPGRNGEYAALVETSAGKRSVWYATLLDGLASYSWFESIEKAFPHGTAEGRSGFVAAKARLEGPKLILPKGEQVDLLLGDESADDGSA